MMKQECCYNKSEIPNTKEKSKHFADIPEIYGPHPHIDVFGDGGTIIPQNVFLDPKLNPSRSQDHTSSMDASWRLYRTDGLNRSLNLTEIEERQPSAPPANPVPPYNPYFTCVEATEERETQQPKSSGKQKRKFKEMEGVLTLDEQRALTKGKPV